jgi:hypothetical protein
MTVGPGDSLTKREPQSLHARMPRLTLKGRARRNEVEIYGVTGHPNHYLGVPAVPDRSFGSDGEQKATDAQWVTR